MSCQKWNNIFMLPGGNLSSDLQISIILLSDESTVAWLIQSNNFVHISKSG